MEKNTTPLFKPFACYLVGVTTTAIAVSAGHGRGGLICFGLGVLSVALGAAWALKSPKRAAWVVARLVRVHDMQPKPTRRVRGISVVESKPVPSAFAEAVLGLRGLGCDLATARRLAGEATQRLPEDAKVEDVLKVALSIRTARAAAWTARAAV